MAIRFDPSAYGQQNAERLREALAPSGLPLARLHLPAAPDLRPGERAPLESIEQQLFFRRVRDYAQDVPALAYVAAVPNGGFRKATEAKRLIGEGVNPGIPDTLLPFPVGSYKGWFGELKRVNARPSDLSPEQRRWLAWLNEQGYWAKWHKGHAAMWNDLVDYLRLGEGVNV